MNPCGWGLGLDFILVQAEQVGHRERPLALCGFHFIFVFLR